MTTLPRLGKEVINVLTSIFIPIEWLNNKNK